MKTFLLALFIFSGIAASAQSSAPPAATPSEVLKLKDSTYDFGKIQQGRPVTTVFEIMNVSSEPLVLENVVASCGCTTPAWNREAIKPGGTSSIKVGYNAAAEGVFSKTITVQYGGSKTKTIIITGNVYKAPATSVPANTSLSLLKQPNQ